MNQSEVNLNLLDDEILQGRTRLSSDRMDISFGELITMYKNKELIIKPDYQRLYRWTDQQKTNLIESLLVGIPIPPIFVAEDKEGIWELVDGLQRLATVISFFGDLDKDATITASQLTQEDDNEDEDEPTLLNLWYLGKGGILKSIEGLNVETLPSKYKINLKRATCRVEILRGESNLSMKYELFKRLNSGGSKLTPQEMRNAMYRTASPILHNLIAELSKNALFSKYTGLSKQKKKELYDQELVLKFIALFNNIDNAGDNTENILNSFMEKVVQDLNFDDLYYKKMFLKVFDLIDKLNDPQVFRTKNNLFVPAEFEGIMVGVAQNISLYEQNIELLRSRIQVLKNDSEFKKLSGSASNSKGRIRNRLGRANDIFKNPAL